MSDRPQRRSYSNDGERRPRSNNNDRDRRSGDWNDRRGSDGHRGTDNRRSENGRSENRRGTSDFRSGDGRSGDGRRGDARGGDDRRRREDRGFDGTPRRRTGRDDPRSNRQSTAKRGTGSANRPPEPVLPDDIAPDDLDPTARRDLRGLDRENADLVARHMVQVVRLLDEEPERALEHARAAARRAGRIAVVRETAGIAAYNAGEWAEAASELRAARRMSGNNALLPMIADCERGLGRPERAIDLARGEEGRSLSGDDAAEMRMVEAGARLDQGEPDKAVVTLAARGLNTEETGTSAARYFYAYAEALHAAGRKDEALTWFMNAAAADVDDETDAEERLVELADNDEANGSEHPDTPLCEIYDVMLLDLDGTVYQGAEEIPGAAKALGALSNPLYYVTNNASRSAEAVSAHLVDLGFAATPAAVVTSAQTAARLLADQLPAGALVLVVGAQSLVDAVTDVGLRVTGKAEGNPVAVVQGHSTETGWAQLSEAVLAIANGATWVACNVDATLPSERGMLVGNGSMVAAVRHATGLEPEVAGKPSAPIFDDAIARSRAERPLAIGDRLDTDIAGANAAGLDSLLVLTGVSGLAAAAGAPEGQRPTYVARDLTGLSLPASTVGVGANADWAVEVLSDRLVVAAAKPDADPNLLAPAILHAGWQAPSTPTPRRIVGDGDVAVRCLAELGVR